MSRKTSTGSTSCLSVTERLRVGLTTLRDGFRGSITSAWRSRLTVPGKDRRYRGPPRMIRPAAESGHAGRLHYLAERGLARHYRGGLRAQTVVPARGLYGRNEYPGARASSQATPLRTLSKEELCVAGLTFLVKAGGGFH
jgi:hypothetical protein